MSTQDRRQTQNVAEVDRNSTWPILRAEREVSSFAVAAVAAATDEERKGACKRVG